MSEEFSALLCKHRTPSIVYGLLLNRIIIIFLNDLIIFRILYCICIKRDFFFPSSTLPHPDFAYSHRGCPWRNSLRDSHTAQLGMEGQLCCTLCCSVAFVYHDLRGRGLPKRAAADALCIYFFNSKLRLETKALTHGLVHFS